MASDTEITKVRIVIRHLLWQIREVRNDRDAAWKWVNRFANTLQYQDLEQDPDQYALAILAEARSFNDQKKRNGQMKWVREQLEKEGFTRPTQEQLDEKWLEMYGNEFKQDAQNGNAWVDMSDAGNGAASKSPTSCETFTADVDIREDSQAKTDGSAITRNETRNIDALEPSANLYNGDAATREGAEAFNRRESGAAAPTTVSMNMRRVPQNGAPAHGFSGGRTAQGTMSLSPEEAAQSGKASALDGLPDKDVQSAKTRDNRESGRYAQPSCSPEDGNPAETAPSHCGSVASLEARQGQARESQRRTGGSSVRGMAKVAQPPVRPRAKNSRCPNSRDEFHAFVADNNLHDGLAEEWYAMHEAREWVDRDGKPIKEWRGALYNYCTKTEQKRRTA